MECLELDIDNGVAVVALNRPESMNALNGELREQMIGLVARVVPHESLMSEALGLARAIAANPRMSVVQAKIALNASQRRARGS